MWTIPCICYGVLFLNCIFALSDITSHPNWKLVDDENCGIAVTDRIIGGRLAGLGQFPWLAQIGYASKLKPVKKQFKFKCGAALINRLNVLTAAHCVVGLAAGEYVEFIRLGEHNIGTQIDCDGGLCAAPVQDIAPLKIVVHDYYDIPVFKNDIGVIHLSKPAVYNGWVTSVCMPRGTQLTENYNGQLAQVAGWGVYNNDINEPSQQLLYITLPIQPLEKCVFAYKKYTDIGEEQLCAGGIVDQDSCSGDSGGPLTKVEAVNGPPRNYQLGIVSFGPRHCGGKSPAVYTKIAYYLEWILDNIRH